MEDDRLPTPDEGEEVPPTSLQTADYTALELRALAHTFTRDGEGNVIENVEALPDSGGIAVPRSIAETLVSRLNDLTPSPRSPGREFVEAMDVALRGVRNSSLGFGESLWRIPLDGSVAAAFTATGRMRARVEDTVRQELRTNPLRTNPNRESSTVSSPPAYLTHFTTVHVVVPQDRATRGSPRALRDQLRDTMGRFFDVGGQGGYVPSPETRYRNAAGHRIADPNPAAHTITMRLCAASLIIPFSDALPTQEGTGPEDARWVRQDLALPSEALVAAAFEAAHTDPAIDYYRVTRSDEDSAFIITALMVDPVPFSAWSIRSALSMLTSIRTTANRGLPQTSAERSWHKEFSMTDEAMARMTDTQHIQRHTTHTSRGPDPVAELFRHAMPTARATMVERDAMRRRFAFHLPYTARPGTDYGRARRTSERVPGLVYAGNRLNFEHHITPEDYVRIEFGVLDRSFEGIQELVMPNISRRGRPNLFMERDEAAGYEDRGEEERVALPDEETAEAATTRLFGMLHPPGPSTTPAYQTVYGEWAMGPRGESMSRTVTRFDAAGRLVSREVETRERGETFPEYDEGASTLDGYEPLYGYDQDGGGYVSRTGKRKSTKSSRKTPRLDLFVKVSDYSYRLPLAAVPPSVDGDKGKLIAWIYEGLRTTEEQVASIHLLNGVGGYLIALVPPKAGSARRMRIRRDIKK